MRQSTLARIVLFCYGLNFTGITLAALCRFWGFLAGHFVMLILCSLWLEHKYFDKEERDAKNEKA